jgi:hypothetical protein
MREDKKEVMEKKKEKKKQGFPFCSIVKEGRERECFLFLVCLIKSCKCNVWSVLQGRTLLNAHHLVNNRSSSSLEILNTVLVKDFFFCVGVSNCPCHSPHLLSLESLT